MKDILQSKYLLIDSVTAFEQSDCAVAPKWHDPFALRAISRISTARSCRGVATVPLQKVARPKVTLCRLFQIIGIETTF